MDQDKSQAGKKVGTDGLTKKERRALRVGVTGPTGNNPNAKNNQADSKDLTNNSAPTKAVPTKGDTPAPGKSPRAKVCAIPIIRDHGKELKLPPKLNTEEGKSNEVGSKELSKADLKAQRRAVQEAQRLTKVNLKNVDQRPVQEGKQKEEMHQAEKKNESGSALSKAELKAQRRAVQEAQRLAKANVKVETVVMKPSNDKAGQQKAVERKASPKKDLVKSVNKHKVPLFNHLYFQKMEVSNLKSDMLNITGVHSAFLRLGAQYSSKTILGSNARCLALLSALKCLISDFTTPPKQEFCRSLESTLQTCVTHLQNGRPLAVSMTNALRHFKLYLTQINTNIPDDEKRTQLINCVDTYIYDEIQKAGEAISMQVREKISNDDVILTYGCSSLIRKILLDAHKEGKTFKVIVVDARPLLEGKEMLRKLVCAGIQCSYILINAASFIMSRVTKVLLGAHALLANGYVMSRTGTAQIALIANAYKKPVLVCCETYKFSERVQTDSFVYNEIGDPDKLVTIDTLQENSSLVNWQSSNYLTLLNLMYDVTPPDLVTAVVTELAFLPCTSVPVILRIRPTEIIT